MKLQQKRQYSNATAPTPTESTASAYSQPSASIRSSLETQEQPSIGTGLAPSSPSKVITHFTYLPSTGTAPSSFSSSNASYSYEPVESSQSASLRSENATNGPVPTGSAPLGRFNQPSQTLPTKSDNVSFVYAPTGHASPYNSSAQHQPPANGSCGRPTVNVVSASMDWWYTETYTQIESTFLIQTGPNHTVTGWTLLPAATSFDVTDALAAPTCTSKTAFNPKANSTMLEYSCWDTPTPVAAATTTVEQTAYKAINQTSAKGTIPDVVVTPTPAALTIDSTATFDAGTPVVHFSQYEIVSGQLTRERNGHIACAETTATHTLNETFSFPYVGQDPNGTEPAEQGIIGGLHFAFLQAIGAESAAAGTFSADPTVVVVVEKGVAATTVMQKGFAPAPAASLATPTPTLPSGLSIAQDTPTQTGIIWIPLTAHIESSQAALEVPSKVVHTTADADVTPNVNYVPQPFEANVKSSDVIIDIAVNPTAGDSVVTAVYDGETVLATALPLSQGSDDGGFGRIISAIGNAAQQSNAAQIESMAVGTNPTASAIAAIIGAVPGTPSSGQGSGSGIVSGSGSGSGSGSSNSASGNGGASGSGQALGSNSGSNSGSISGGSSSSNSGSGSDSSSGSGQQSPVLHIGSSEITAAVSPGQTVPALVLDGQTAVAGGAAITVSGTRISLAADGTAVAIGGSTTNIGVDGRPERSPVLEMGGSAVTAGVVGTALPAALVIAGQTVSAGGPAISVDGTAVSLLPGGNAVVIGGSTTSIALATSGPGAEAAAMSLGGGIGAAANIPLITMGSQVFTANAATQYNLGGAILTPGGSAVVSGATISLSPDATKVVVNGQTRQLSAPAITPAPLVTIDGTVYAPNLGSTYDIGSQHQLLTPGGEIIVSGTTVSLASDGSAVLVNGVVQSSGRSSNANEFDTITAPPVLTIDGTIFSPSGATKYIVSGETLTPGGAITITGENGGVQTISLDAEMNRLLSASDGTTRTSVIGMLGSSPSGAPILTIDGEKYTADSFNVGSGATYLINDQTLTPGGTVVVSGSDGLETISLVPDGTAIVAAMSGTTWTSQISGAYGVLPTAAPILTIGGETFTAINNGATYVIDGETLTPGGTDTLVINGQTYIVTLFPHATMLEIQVVDVNGKVISTIFETLFPATMTGATAYRTQFASGATATARATATAAPGASATSSGSASLAGTGSSLAVEATGILLALSSFALAVCL